MKISELKYAPRWLLEARTSNADVEIINGRVIWKSGTWEGGTWEGGFWEYGFWKSGFWEGGFWEGGFWKSGFWEGGFWEGGIWEGGTWKSGVEYSARCRWLVGVSGTNIRIGCKTKTVEEWDQWFAGTEVFQTPRGTEAFRRIHMAYELAKMRVKLEADIRAAFPRN